MAFGPTGAQLQPDPILTNILADSSAGGGWLHERIAAVRPTVKDYVRFGVQDAKTLLGSFDRTLRSPGARANLASLPVLAWVLKAVSEQAIRVEYTQEDVNNSISPLQPKVNAARRVGNILNYAEEAAVAALLDPANMDSAHKTAAAFAWTGSTSKIVQDVQGAKTAFTKLSGVQPNFLRIPAGKLAGIMASTEVASNASGAFAALFQRWIAAGTIDAFMGLTVLVGGARQDLTAPSAALTPTFLWDAGNLGTSVQLGYSPVLGGGSWGGDGPAAVVQFENQLNGTAFEAYTYQSPYFQENGVYIVHGNFRRTDPFVANADLLYSITGV